MAGRPVASLSSGLLARPGQAKPAMRPQAFAPTALDDLGWNDMGQHTQAVVQPAPQPSASVVAPVPPVLVERASLSRAVAPAPEPAASEPAKAPAAAAQKAAFTLRLDRERHLRLRLASALAGRSSQLLVVEALDAFLNSNPQVEALARQVPGPNPFSGEKP